MIWAIYRLHYGVDFIKQSINSIKDDVDKIFIFYSLKPWVKKDQIKYQNKFIQFPENPENVELFLKENFSTEKIFIKNYECKTPLNQFGKLFDLSCEIENKKPKYVLFMEPDMIFGKKQLNKLKLELKLKFWLNFLIARQIEIWKYEITSKSKNTFRIPLRKKRVGPALWKVNDKFKIETQFGGGSQKKKNNFSSFIKILNMGFSFNKNTMLYKHLTAMVFSEVIGDSVPDENWYEKKWLNWKIDSKNLEISEGSQHLIKQAYTYTIPDKYYKYLH